MIKHLCSGKPHRKKVHLILAVMLTVFLFSSLASQQVCAAQNRSFTIIMRDVETDQPVGGGSFAYYKIGEVEVSGASVSYHTVAAFSEIGSAIDGRTQDQVMSRETAQTFDDYVMRHGITGTDFEVSEDGKAKISDIPEGIYLIRQTSPAEGYVPVQPFCIAFPYIKDGQPYNTIISYPKVIAEEEPETETETEPETESESESETETSPSEEEETVPESPGDNTPGEPSEPETPTEDIPEEDNPKSDRHDNDTPEEVKPKPEEETEPDRSRSRRGYLQLDNLDPTLLLVDPNVPKDILSLYGPEGIDAIYGSDRLPQTGQLNWPIPVLAISGSLLFLFGWRLKHKNDEAQKKE